VAAGRFFPFASRYTKGILVVGEPRVRAGHQRQHVDQRGMLDLGRVWYCSQDVPHAQQVLRTPKEAELWFFSSFFYR
jgi:hypothetical protein